MAAWGAPVVGEVRPSDPEALSRQDGALALYLRLSLGGLNNELNLSELWASRPLFVDCSALPSSGQTSIYVVMHTAPLGQQDWGWCSGPATSS